MGRGFRPGLRVRLLVGLIALAALVAASVALLNESTPPHGRVLDSIFEDDELLLDSPATTAGDVTVQRTLETLKSLGADRIRVIVPWASIAPGAKDSSEPLNFDATNPSDYGHAWEYLDRLDVLAHADGLALYFDLSAPAPLWAATPVPGGGDAPYATEYEPSASAFGRFVQAVGERYDGSYRPVGATAPLPRVSFWSIWNEPNQPGWLAPQQNAAGNDVAPELYRSYVDAGWSALAATGHTTSRDTILFGELAPEGCTVDFCQFPKGDAAIPPITFLQDLYCVSATYMPLSGSAAVAVGCPATPNEKSFVAENPALFDASGLSEHPYNFEGPPTQTFAAAADSGFAPLSELAKLGSSLDRLFAAYGSQRQLPLYLTEYGYVTSPPESFLKYPVTPAEQAAYLDEATYIAYQDPRVRALGQFELRDSAPQPSGWFPEGLEYINAVHKPAFDAYRLPIWVPNPTTPLGGLTTVWGMLRPARNDSTQTALIQWRSLQINTWKTLAVTTTRDPSNFIEERVALPNSGLVRIAWTSPSHTILYSREVAVTVAATGAAG